VWVTNKSSLGRDHLFRRIAGIVSVRAMAWRSHGKTNEELVDNLRHNGVFSSEIVANVMKQVDRAKYCSKSAYQDAPQSIGFSVTISAPHMHASALQLLQDKLKPGTSSTRQMTRSSHPLLDDLKGNRCLDVGCGSGYLTACMALMVSPNGKAIGIDHIEELVDFSRQNILQDQPQLLSSGVLELIGSFIATFSLSLSPSILNSN
jgi:protein-L-isoaspartate(D-aspartate) O-methyltransferase